MLHSSILKDTRRERENEKSKGETAIDAFLLAISQANYTKKQSSLRPDKGGVISELAELGVTR